MNSTITFSQKNIFLTSLIILTLSALGVSQTDSLRNALLQQKIKEIEQKTISSKSQKQIQQDSLIRVWEDRCLFVKNKRPGSDCENAMWVLAQLYLDRSKDEYAYKYSIYKDKVKEHLKDSSVIIPEKPEIDYSKTITIYEQFVIEFNYSPRLSRVYLELIRIYRNLGNDSLQEKYLDLLIAKFPQQAKNWCLMPPVLINCINDDPDQELLRKADLLLKAGKYIDAKEIYLNSIEKYQTFEKEFFRNFDTQFDKVMVQNKWYLCVYAQKQLLKLMKCQGDTINPSYLKTNKEFLGNKYQFDRFHDPSPF